MLFKKFFTLSYDDGVEQDKKLIALLDRLELNVPLTSIPDFWGKSIASPAVRGRIFGMMRSPVTRSKRYTKIMKWPLMASPMPICAS